jgi:hypothetical protein
LDTQLEPNFLEPPKLKDLQGLEKTNKPLYEWRVFFSDVNIGAATEHVSHPQAKETFEILNSVSAAAQERLEAERRIRYVREVNDIKDYHLDEGKQANTEIGREEGKAEATRELVGRLLECKFGPLSPEHQALLNAATIEQLGHYAEVFMTAPSLQEVLAP